MKQFRQGDKVFWSGSDDAADLPPIRGTFVEERGGEARVTFDMETVLDQHVEVMPGLSRAHANYTVALDELTPASKWPVLEGSST